MTYDVRLTRSLQEDMGSQSWPVTYQVMYSLKLMLLVCELKRQQVYTVPQPETYC